MKAVLALLLLFLSAVPALAQWQVPADHVPLGRGPGVTGFKDGGGTAVNIQTYGATCSAGAGSDNTTAIQAAITATPPGGTLYIPQCPTATPYYVVAGSGTCIFTRSFPINIRGDGRNGSLIGVAASVPNTRDVFCIQAAAIGVTQGFGFRDFQIAQIGGVGAAARHAIHFDFVTLSGNSIFNATIQRMNVVPTLGGNSIKVTGSGSNSLAYSLISDNNLESINLTTALDGISIQNNVISAAGTNNAVLASFVSGAAGFSIGPNNVMTGPTTIVSITSGTTVTIAHNYLETNGSDNSPLVDLNTSGGTFLSPQLVGNQYSILTGTAVAIRVRTGTTNARIADARILNQTGTNFIQIDSGAAGTVIDTNIQYVNAGVVTAASISDSGKGSHYSSREVFVAARTYFVRSTGSDTLCNGMTDAASASAPACAFASWQKASNVIANTIDCNGFAVTVQESSGGTHAYTAGVIQTTPYVNCIPIFDGNSTATITAAGNAFEADANVQFTVKNITVISTGGDGVAALSGGVVNWTNTLTCGAVAGSCLHAKYGGKVFGFGPLALSGNSTNYMLWAEIGASVISIIGQTVTLNGSPTFTNFIWNVDGAIVFLQGTTFSGAAGGAGKKFNIQTNSVVETALAGTAGTCAAPGALIPGTGGFCDSGGVLH